MKIVFTSAHRSSPSYIFYSANLMRINGVEAGISLEIADNPKSVDYSSYDAALFMGFDQQALLAKKQNPAILVGVVEPRAAQKNDFKGVDFIVSNSIESKDYFARFNENILLYYVYPQAPEKKECPLKKEGVVLGYHGNLIHLQAMIPRVTDAISMLAKEMPVELWAMYNIRGLGEWRTPSEKDLGFRIVHIQYSEENFATYIANTDIGIVPQLIPTRENHFLWQLAGFFDKKYRGSNNYFLQFKETTNIGRHIVFAQYGIPVVSDMTPSACALIDDERSGFIAYHSQGWLRVLKKLALDKDLRKQVGENLRQEYFKYMTIEILNKKLLSYIMELSRKTI